VHLKERRPLVLVPRETPLGIIGLENMRSAAVAGAVILPAAPGFYHQPESIQDLVDFIVARVCDQLGVEVELTSRWGDNPPDDSPSG
jgi:4-hydroxy-3-polyprenylbenzoate decarboxylase